MRAALSRRLVMRNALGLGGGGPVSAPRATRGGKRGRRFMVSELLTRLRAELGHWTRGWAAVGGYRGRAGGGRRRERATGAPAVRPLTVRDSRRESLLASLRSWRHRRPRAQAAAGHRERLVLSAWQRAMAPYRPSGRGGPKANGCSALPARTRSGDDRGGPQRHHLSRSTPRGSATLAW